MTPKAPVAAELTAVHLVKRFGGITATDNVSLSFRAGELHALIGPNGAGKTTLLAQLAGQLAPSAGQITLDGEDITGMPMAARARCGVARSFQITSICREFTALENVALAVQAHAGSSFRFWGNVRHAAGLNEQARQALEEVGLAERADVVSAFLSHGEQRQLELAIALACRPRVLLLDEPLAGMGVSEGNKMVALLKRMRGRFTIVMVEHDMEAVFSLADRISVLVYGRVLVTGSPDEIRANERVQHAYLGDEYEEREAVGAPVKVSSTC